jgi:hypothetical protein
MDCNFNLTRYKLPVWRSPTKPKKIHTKADQMSRAFWEFFNSGVN